MNLFVKTGILSMICSSVIVSWIVLDQFGFISHDYVIWSFPFFAGMLIFGFVTIIGWIDIKILSVR